MLEWVVRGSGKALAVSKVRVVRWGRGIPKLKHSIKERSETEDCG